MATSASDIDLKRDSFTLFLQQKSSDQKKKKQQQQSDVDGGFVSLSPNSESCNQIYNGCLTRSKEIEFKLESAIQESNLPRFDQLVEHLRSRKHYIDENGCDIIDPFAKFKDDKLTTKIGSNLFESSMDFDLDNISIVPALKENNSNENFSGKNYDLFLKEYVSLVSQFINLVDKSVNQHIIEKAAVYLLWVFYDSSNLNQLCNQNDGQSSLMNGAYLNSNYSNLEYIFCLETLNNQIFDRISFVARSLFELMDHKFLNTVFYYPSMIRKAANDVEMNERKDFNWFDTFEQNMAKQNLINEYVDPFENESYNFFPINTEDTKYIEQATNDFNLFNFDYSNSEFVLQSLISNSKLPLVTNFQNNLTSNTSNDKSVEKQTINEEFYKPSEPQSAEESITLLSAELSSFIFKYNSSHNESYYLSQDELFNTVLNWLIENGPDDELSIELSNLLGDESFDLISKIITFYKPNILKANSNVSQQPFNSNHNENACNDKTKLERTEKLWKLVCQTKGTNGVGYGPSIVVQTEKEKDLKKEMRKIEKKLSKEISKAQKNATDDLSNGTVKLTMDDLEKMRQQNLKASIRAALEPRFEEPLRPAKTIEKYPFVFDLMQNVKTTASFIAETKLLLPTGFEKKEFRTHDEVSIPIISSSEETNEFLKKFPSIEINDTDEFCRIAFDGFQKLNLIQSTVFQTAYQTDNQNMLICAPTGAGKTNIAMLTILNILRNYSVDGTPNCIKHEQFKIVYIAPMKALCAEMTSNFGRRLQPFGVKVRELTGDMQLTSKEIMETQMLVVTPEKWDIVTRKSVGDVQLLDLVRLIIIDEVHLLQSDRGHVLETLVARTIRYVEQAQKCIRLIGLSATLPNYIDVAQFLHVDLYKGLFVFDDRFRPVPLSKTFIGCKSTNRNQLNTDMDDITFTKARDILVREHQVMVFVHSRNATLQLANYLLERSQYTAPGEENVSSMFVADTARMPGSDKLIARARYRNLNKLLLNGLGIHHAGMPRSERNVVEKLFNGGVIKVLVCTSTLAWGVNLPAHAVIIRGTEYYDPSQGHMVDIDMLDVMQIFGRAGRPQFDTDGEATIITTYSKLSHYLSMLTNQLPIESRFLKRLTDNLNAEIVLGTVSNIAEAVDWLRYTYAFIRMHKNPLEYGLTYMASVDQSMIFDHLYSLVRSSAEQLDRAEMARYNPDMEGILESTHLGRIASHFYIQHETIVHFNESLRESMDFGHILDMLSKANEFSQLRCRDDEFSDLDNLRYSCWYHTKGEITNTHTKVNILMQAAISRASSECHSLSSDLMYILQNVSRLTRGLFEYVIKRGWPLLAERFLSVSLMFEKQIWFFDTPLLQFESDIPSDVLTKLSNLTQKQQLGLYDLREMRPDEIGERIHHKKYGSVVKQYARMIPYLEVTATVKPVTRTILIVYVDVKPDFIWDDKVHGKTGQIFWIWLTDLDNNHIYHAELGRLTKKQVIKEEVQHYVFTIPLLDASHLQQQYLIHCTFEYWMGTDTEISVSCENILLPDKHLPMTKLLDLMPLPVTALQNELYQSMYAFTHFNPIQTQIFHTLYHTDYNVLLGAPTGSGKTIAAEIALFRVFNTKPGAKVVYIAPLKALVRERVDDWKIKIERNMGRRVVELTGDVTPDLGAITSADVIVTTPEKWDGVSRGWPSRSYVREVALIIIDEIHLLGEERGPVLEMIVSRANFITRRTGGRIRIVGLSTAVANAQDLAAWLNIQKVGLYNFSPSVRPVPIEVHVSGFSGKHYCPRMASMNKPAFRAIKKYSPEKPVIIFVSSRRQTRLTALDLITLIASDVHSHGLQYLRIEADELDNLLECVNDAHLKHSLSFGIGMHHAGLREGDRKIVEELFASQKIQVLITTATLAWGVNLPAHAVIIKGTEFFDGKKGRYVDFPITDVLQMIGRAGRPQFDTSAVAVLFVHDIKKEYYKKFLYEPFPVESQLLDAFPDHLNAEIMSGTVQSKHEAMEFLSSTYLYHRIIKNPSYYGVDLSEIGNQEELTRSEVAINTLVVKFLSEFIDKCVKILEDDYCIRCINLDDKTENMDFDEIPFVPQGPNTKQKLISTPLGKISSYYYLSHGTIRLFQDSLGAIETGFKQSQIPHLTQKEVLDLLTQATEYATLPVRHNEEFLNEELSKKCPIKLHRRSMESPHTKANLLIQAHCSRLALPIVDYYTDLKMVLDQAIRIMQSMIDISAINGSLPTTLNIILLQQCILQSIWQHTNQLIMLVETDDNVKQSFEDNTLNDATEYFDSLQNKNDSMLADLNRIPSEIASIPYLLHVVHANPNNPIRALRDILSPYQIHGKIIDRLNKSLLQLPLIELEDIYIAEADPIDERSKKIAISKEEIFKSAKEMKWHNLKSDTNYLIECRFLRRPPPGQSRNRSNRNQKAFCPRYHKPKSESWYLVLGIQEQSELVTIARVPVINSKYRNNQVIQFRTPSIINGNERVIYSLYLLSDCYVGLDQQYNLPLNIHTRFS